MRIYRCYFLSERDGINEYENIEAHALDEAVDRALALLRQTAEAQGNRDLGRTEPAISGQEKTARPIQNFCLGRNGQSVHLKQSCDTAPGSPTG